MCGIDLEEQDEEVENCEGKISSHDIPQPVGVGFGTRNAVHVEGVGQWVVVRQTSSTQNSSLV